MPCALTMLIHNTARFESVKNRGTFLSLDVSVLFLLFRRILKDRESIVYLSFYASQCYLNTFTQRLIKMLCALMSLCLFKMPCALKASLNIAYLISIGVYRWDWERLAKFILVDSQEFKRQIIYLFTYRFTTVSVSGTFYSTLNQNAMGFDIPMLIQNAVRFESVIHWISRTSYPRMCIGETGKDSYDLFLLIYRSLKGKESSFYLPFYDCKC